MATGQALLLLILSGVAKPGAGRCPSCEMAALDPEVQKTVLIELAKQSILSKLHLKERPNVTQPVFRAGLLTALWRLRVGRTNQSITSEMPNQSPKTDEQEYEILSFAEPGPAAPNRTRLHFHFTQDAGRSVQVLHADMYVFLAAPGGPARRVTVKLLLSEPGNANPSLVGRRQLEVKQGGWAAVEVRTAVQSFFSKGGQRLTAELELEGSPEPALLLSSSESHRPFMVAKTRARPRHRLHRRAVECNSNSRTCCRKQFFVDFKEIGWEDWIIQPEGYHMNYCIGPCPTHVAGMPGLASSFHTAILNLIKANDVHAAFSSCCIPTRRWPLSLLYYDQDSNVVKTDIPDMIVEACGCT
ncbi:inhibin beta C chain-like [Gopherus flavomarginatus]|uniref:inhibin beta C chain-like n=1 Tax=Gopherus flavomarginatus TaxID=286002 RepID=UPI0021CBB124|nr:inhibin beta C chain-like [Gopherus flavomarginatus]